MKLKDTKRQDRLTVEVKSQENEISNEEACENNYFCPKVWIKVKEFNDKDEKEECLVFLEKIRTFTINLYVKYVNLFNQNNDLLRINHCYSINESNQSDTISQHFCSFLMFLNLHVQNYTELSSSEDITRYVESFYDNYNNFLKKNFQFIGTNDLKQLEMRIENQTKVHHLENSDLHIEKRFLEYLATIESINFLMIMKLKLNNEDYKIQEIEKTINDGLQMLASKVAKDRDILFSKKNITIGYFNKSYNHENNDLHEYYDELNVDYDEHHSYLDEDNFFDVKNDEQKFKQETKDLFRNTSSYNLTMISTDQLYDSTYENVFSTEPNNLIQKNSATINLENKATSNNIFSWAFVFVIFGVGVATCLVGIAFALYYYFDKKIKVKEGRKVSIENIELLVGK